MHLAVSSGRWTKEAFSPLLEQWLELVARLAQESPDLRITWIGPAGATSGAIPESFPETSRWERVRYEQTGLPREAQRVGADLLFVPYPCAPLRSGLPVVAAGEEDQTSVRPGISGRAGWSLCRAGMRGARAVIVYSDEPTIEGFGLSIRTVPASVGTAFRALPSPEDGTIRNRMQVPEGYVLSIAPPLDGIDTLLAAWTWVDGSVGESTPLVIAGLSPDALEVVRASASERDVSGSVVLTGPLVAADVPALFRGAQAYLHPAGGASAQVLRWAMACGVPVAAVESLRSAAVLGDAAYLAPEEDSRALGAACLTLIVEPEVSDSLRQKGLLRATGFHGEAALRAVHDVFQEVVDRNRAGARQGGAQ